MDTDTRIATAVAALYLVLCVFLLPASEYPRALGGGVAVFALVAAVAWRLGRGPVHAMSVVGVAFASAAVLWVPTFPAMGGRHPAAVPIGFLGVQAAALLWAARRWISRPPEARTPLRTAWRFGAIAAALVSAVATIPILLAFVTGQADAARMLLVYPAYLAGMLGAATVYWLLQRIAHLAVGRYLVGAVGGTCVYGAVAPLAVLARGEPFDVAEMAILSAIIGGLVGPAVALGLADGAPAPATPGGWRAQRPRAR
ncbi:MAG TPA: hypothetical protein VFR81_07205 [Longimicrobium sp.]|nr:hypothetical protein [Longimicrobium sp.]